MRVHGASDHGVVETADTKSYVPLLDLPVGISLPRIFSPIGVHTHPTCCRNHVPPSCQNMPTNVLEGVDNLTFETFAGRFYHFDIQSWILDTVPASLDGAEGPLPDADTWKQITIFTNLPGKTIRINPVRAVLVGAGGEEEEIFAHIEHPQHVGAEHGVHCFDGRDVCLMSTHSEMATRLRRRKLNVYTSRFSSSGYVIAGVDVLQAGSGNWLMWDADDSTSEAEAAAASDPSAEEASPAPSTALPELQENGCPAASDGLSEVVGLTIVNVTSSDAQFSFGQDHSVQDNLVDELQSGFFDTNGVVEVSATACPLFHNPPCHIDRSPQRVSGKRRCREATSGMLFLCSMP